MKISIFYSGGYPGGAAAISRIKLYAKGLIEIGYDVEILLFHEIHFNNNHNTTCEDADFQGIPFKILSVNNRNTDKIINRALALLIAYWKSFKYVLENKRKVNLIHLYCPNILRFFPVILIAKCLSIPVIIEQTELASKLNKDGLQNRIVQIGHIITEKFVFNFCDHLFVISCQLYNYYSNKFPRARDRLTLIPIIVDMGRFNMVNQLKTLRIGHLGGFSQKDRVDGLVNAFCKAVKKNPNIKLRLIGELPNLYLINKVKNTALTNNVDESLIEFTGWVPDELLPQLLAECDLLVINRSHSQYAGFGFPSKLGEYLATGKPVIATKVGDIEKYITDGKDIILTEPENDDQLADKIILRYKNYDEYSKIGEIGKQTCQKFFNYKNIIKLADIKIRMLTAENNGS